MSIVREIKALYHLALSPIRGATHEDRLESFYRGQADAYDQYRRHLLKGREEMYAALPLQAGDVLVEMGAGTGQNLEFLGERVGLARKIYLVDLSRSLLEVADRRIRDRQWRNVQTIHADATTFSPEESVDVVTFSYSLTMIPDWFAALEGARAMLRPGGSIGVVDFYVSRKYPEAGRARHGWWTRTFWPIWFGFDNVCLNPDHVPYLHRAYDIQHFEESRARIRYLPLVRVPYYSFIGRKR